MEAYGNHNYGTQSITFKAVSAHAPHTPSKVTAPISPGVMCVPQPTYTQTPELLDQTLKPVPCHLFPGPPDAGLLPAMEAEHSPLPMGSADTTGAKRINEANFDLAPSYGT